MSINHQSLEYQEYASYVIYSGHIHQLKELLKHKLNLNKKIVMGRKFAYPLEIAFQSPQDNKELIQLLLAEQIKQFEQLKRSNSLDLYELRFLMDPRTLLKQLVKQYERYGDLL